MSAFAAIANLDGHPVDVRIMRAMTAHLAPLGPDGCTAWTGGWNRNVALIHAKFATTDEGKREQQPFTQDGSSWVAGDLRIDARDELRVEFHGRTEPADDAEGDAALLLRAYAAWGPAFVEHVLGDFSFALWDGRNRRLVCARDHMGVRPLYFYQSDAVAVCSNSLECILIHPNVPDTVSEETLTDFLLFGENTHPDTTIYKHVRRLPPAHRLVASSSGTAVERYWTFPIEEPVYYKRDGEYGERFRALVDAAVKDRLRTSKVAVFMSGGIDSSTLAAVASRRFADPAEHVRAHTILVDGPQPDDEPRYVDQVARHLGITVRYRRKGAAFYDPEWQQRDLVCPEPNFQQFSFHEAVQHYQAVAADARVAYWGEGPDNALTFEWRPHLRHLAARGRWLRVLMDARSYRRHHPRGLSWGTLRRAIRRNNERVSRVRGWYPPWMRPHAEHAYDLRRRWIETYAGCPSTHPTRPQAYDGVTNHTFPNMCEHFAPGWHKTPLEFRHPYLDVRVLRFMLTVPAVPWCRNKLVMRKAAETLLPRECVWRPKASVRGEPWRAAFEGQPEPAFLSREQMNEYVDVDRVKLREQDGLWGFALAENVFAVDYWLSKRAACRTAHDAADRVKYAQL